MLIQLLRKFETKTNSMTNQISKFLKFRHWYTLTTQSQFKQFYLNLDTVKNDFNVQKPVICATTESFLIYNEKSYQINPTIHRLR